MGIVKKFTSPDEGRKMQQFHGPDRQDKGNGEFPQSTWKLRALV